jgi:hypothetical protein
MPAPEEVFVENTKTEQRWYPVRARQFDELAAYHQARDTVFGTEALYQDGKAHPVVDVAPSEAGVEIRAGGRGMSVLETDLSADAIIEAFETPTSTAAIEEPFESLGEYEEYQVYGAPAGNWVMGVNEGVIVEAFSTGGPSLLTDKQAVVEALIDAQDGDQQYISEHEMLRGIFQRLGSGMIVQAGALATDVDSDEQTAEPIGSGLAYTSADSENATRVYAFKTAAAAESFSRDQSDVARDWEATSVSRDGKFVTITGTNHPI